MKRFRKKTFSKARLLPNDMQVNDSRIAQDGEAALVPSTLKRVAIALGLTLVLVLLWLLTHRYAGLHGDAELYAFQAFARIHPSLATDIYLRYGSQAQYTIFSPIYAYCIQSFGLPNAALLLTIVFKIWFFAASWMFARAVSTSTVAAISTALLIVVVGGYGANGIFRYAEDWVTARSFAEALVITALALYFRGLRVSGLLVALGALLIHPLMALPGFLLLLCLRLPFRVSAVGLVTGLLGSLAIAVAATKLPSSAHFLAVIDQNWLEVVRERSQFLFLQLWSASDWMLNLRPFLSLALSAMILRDPKTSRLLAAAVLVGASGIAVALISCQGEPVAILLQGQAWRWVWVSAFISVALAGPTMFRAWHDRRCGPLSAILILSAWMLPAVAGAVCMAVALLLWPARPHISSRAAFGLRWVALSLSIGVLAWTIHDSRLLLSSWSAEPSHESFLFALLRDIAGVKIILLLLVLLIVRWIRASRPWSVVAISTVLAVASVLLAPRALKIGGIGIVTTEVDDFSDWRRAIPEIANVLVLPSGNSPRFTWFTLERPSYLSVDQSSGVVFSRATALEVRRRATVMLPVADPDWRILSKLSSNRDDSANKAGAYRPLTGAALVSLCADAQLNFVIANENVGFGPTRHTHSGNWKNWNLYDCRQVRATVPAT